MNMMQCNMFGSQTPMGPCILVPFANHIELHADWVCRIPLTSSGLKNGNDALAEDAESVRSLIGKKVASVWDATLKNEDK